MVLHKNASVHVSVYVTYSSTLLLHPALCVCVCVDACVRLLPFIGNSEPLYFCAFLISSSIFYSLSSSSLHLSLAPSLFLGHQNEFFFIYAPPHTIEGLAGWLASRWDSMSCVWCCKETATARWLQTILLLFVFNLYLATVGWWGPTHARTVFSYSRRSCPIQPISLTLGHLANPPEQWWSRAGQSMIDVQHCFVQSYPPAESIPAAPSTLMTPHRQKETEGGLKERETHVAQHNSSIPPLILMNQSRRYKCSWSPKCLTFERMNRQVVLFQFISLFGSILALQGHPRCEWEMSSLCNALLYRSVNPNNFLDGSWKGCNLALK